MSLASAALNAQSGLNTLTAEASVLSRNITGASSTALYSRKIANITAGLGGSQVVSITRASSQAVFDSMLAATSANAAESAISAALDQLNQTIGTVSATDSATPSGDGSPAALLSKFTNALQAYEGSPSDSNLARAAVAAAGDLTNGLNSASTMVDQVREQADADMAASVKTINSLLAQFQSVNAQIVKGTATGADVTDAQDSRDNILAELSKQIGITTAAAPDGGVSIYSDGGVTLFQGGMARSVTFVPTNTYTAATAGNAVYVDGVPITGNSAVMGSRTGTLAGLTAVRDNLAVIYQTQLDGMAGALINSFKESDQTGPGADLPGLFTVPGAPPLTSIITGLASRIQINPSVDPNQGGNPFLLRDGGISGNSNYTYNSSGDASYQSRISQLLSNLMSAQAFSPDGKISTSAKLSDYASGSISWLEEQRSATASQSAYQSALLNTASAALSNATGVNLDDQMSKMLDLENSYSATAKLLSTIDGMFGAFLTDLANLPA
jgi:flagellar hook-associated protein 1 FlgK